MIRIRTLELSEKSHLPRFLTIAAHEEDIETVVLNPTLSIYVGNWGRAGDCAVIAEDEDTNKAVGMAWARVWTAENHGFGWVDERIPEIAIAVEPEFQGQGVGMMLMEALKEHLRGTSLVIHESEIFCPVQVALNVRADSRAVRLYERLGFVRVEGTEQRNRTGGLSFNMVAPL